MKKILLIIALFIAMNSYALAENNSTWSQIKTTIKTYNSEIKWNLKFQKEQVKINNAEFRSEYWNITDYLTWLTETQKAELKKYKDEHQVEIDALKSEYKEKITSATSLEAREELRNELQVEIEKLVLKYYDEVISYLESLQNNEELQAYFEARKESILENQEIRKAWLLKRQEIRWERSEAIVKYKDVYIEKYKSRLDKIAEQKPEILEKTLTKIDTLIEKYENSAMLTEIQKDKIISQLEALKETIEDILNTSEIISEIE